MEYESSAMYPVHVFAVATNTMIASTMMMSKVLFLLLLLLLCLIVSFTRYDLLIFSYYFRFYFLSGDMYLALMHYYLCVTERQRVFAMGLIQVEFMLPVFLFFCSCLRNN